MWVAMPLDTGAVASELNLSWAAEQGASLRIPTLDDGQHVGVALRLVREFRGLDIEDLSGVTRIRRRYLQSIEELKLDQLPSRPFTTGYVRAYAFALGLDGDRAVARFRRDAPDPNEPLQAPVGVRRESDPRLTLLAICGAVVVCGILTWNFAERAMARNPAAPSSVAAAPAKITVAPPPQGPVTLGAPLPAPQESTTPKPYVTPGLEGQMSGADPAAAASAAADAQTTATAAGVDVAQPVGAPFVANGTVYGDANQAASVILQARKAASITVHRADGSIYFARFLSVGQAFRAPLIEGWTVEVSEPTSVDVFVGGALKGPMPAVASPIMSLAG